MNLIGECARALCFLLSGLIPTSQAATPFVTVPGLGDLVGKYTSPFSNVVEFKGIPYAKAPVGELRWQPPQAYGNWVSPWDATAYRDSCVGASLTNKLGGHGESENCLFLNAALQAKDLAGPRERRPVLVWIHGGSYDTGSGSQFAPENIVAAAARPVVVVTINYRINVFGFLGSRALAARSHDGSTGNYGLEDQRLALRWVRDHISAFGGNPEDITIFGESAGGNSVLHHLVQPASFGLYQKAIIESGTYDAGYSLTDADSVYQEIIGKAGCGNNLSCLLNKTSREVEVAKEAMVATSKLTNLHWGPIVDGVSMNSTPQELIRDGKFNNKVPVIIGSNVDEWAAFAMTPTLAPDYPHQMTEVQFDQLLAFLGDSNIREVKRLYNPSNYAYPNLGKYSQWWWMAMRVATDNGIPFKGFPKGAALGHCSARRITEQLVQGGTPAAYMYSFARPLIGGLAEHGGEIPFVFNMRLALGLSPGNHELASAMINYWTEFANAGAPSARTFVQWPKYEPSDNSRANIRFNATFLAANISVEYDLRRAACDFWDSLKSHANVLLV